MNINLYIDRLILDGVDIRPGQRRLLQGAVETELTRLFTEGGISPALAAGVALPRISTSGIQLAGDSDPIQMGQQIAQSVYGGIGK